MLRPGDPWCRADPPGGLDALSLAVRWTIASSLAMEMEIMYSLRFWPPRISLPKFGKQTSKSWPSENPNASICSGIQALFKCE